VTNGSTEQLVSHLRLAKQNGLNESELVEAIVHLAFYAGWLRGRCPLSPLVVARLAGRYGNAPGRCAGTNRSQRASERTPSKARATARVSSSAVGQPRWPPDPA
jgi:carboxymuconolactone decarboxylase family protein